MITIIVWDCGIINMADRDGHKMWRGAHSVPYWLLIGLMLAAFAWRMQGVTQWPMPFHPTLQYENALKTRSIWYQMKGESALPEEQEWLVGYQGRSKGIPIVEFCTAVVYLFAGGETRWVSGVFTSLLWIAAAGFLYAIVRRQLHSPHAAFAAACLFLLHPFTLVISRSFQHEAGQMLGYLFAWWWLAQHDAYADWRQALLASVVAGLALLMKPGIGFIPLCFIHLAYGVQRHGWRKTLSSPWLYVVPTLVLVPSALWMKLIFTGNETHQWKWKLLLTWDWYVMTWDNITRVVGWFPVIITLIVTIWQLSKGRWFGLCLLAGYLAYAVVFNYANMTHNYYLLVLFPIVALAWGEFILWFAPWIKLLFQNYQRNKLLSLQSQQGKLSERQFVPFLVAVMATVLMTRAMADYTSLLTAGPYAPLQNVSRQLGRQLGIGTQIIALTNDYAMPLRYFSGLHAQWWPTQADLWYEGLAGGHVLNARERLNVMLAETRARYFIVTLEDEFMQQKQLVEILQHYRELPTHPAGVRIFELSR